MPTYVYECAKCGEEVEAWQSFAEPPLKKHSGCGGKLTKVLQPVGIVFKGSGFHRTDSRNGGKRAKGDGASDKADSGTSTDSKSDTSSDSSSSKKSTTKTATKPSEKAPVTSAASNGNS